MRGLKLGKLPILTENLKGPNFTIRYDTIEEISVDSKAEYTA